MHESTSDTSLTVFWLALELLPESSCRSSFLVLFADESDVPVVAVSVVEGKLFVEDVKSPAFLSSVVSVSASDADCSLRLVAVADGEDEEVVVVVVVVSSASILLVSTDDGGFVILLTLPELTFPNEGSIGVEL